jgi:hypothetical protein
VHFFLFLLSLSLCPEGLVVVLTLLAFGTQTKKQQQHHHHHHFHHHYHHRRFLEMPISSNFGGCHTKRLAFKSDF